MDRPLTKHEFFQTLSLIAKNGALIDRLRFLAMIKFQFHLISRNDDTAHVTKDSLKWSPQFPQFLTVKMKWSKNVREERDCPNQIIMGSMDYNACAVLGLALFLEKWCKATTTTGATLQWLFVEGTSDRGSALVDVAKEISKGKNQYAGFLKRHVFESNVPGAFVRDAVAGRLGTHSIRKFATTYARQCGGTRDDVDYRARWKSRRQQDRYTDTQLNWPDINTASKLCFGGVCLYKPLEGSGITDEWLAEAVAPSIANIFGNKVAAVLAKPLLWACFEECMEDAVPPDVKRAVVGSFIEFNHRISRNFVIPDGVNPIQRVELIASESGGLVTFLVAPNFGNDEGDQGGGGGGIDPRPRPDGRGVLVPRREGVVHRSHQQWLHAVYSKVYATQSKVNELENRQIESFAKLLRQLHKVQETAQRAAMAPVIRRRPARAVNGSNGGLGNANLLNCPPNLYTLWNEYEVGVGGNKAAKEFTASERGRVKSKYCRRKKFWQAMERLIAGGAYSHTAIRRIYEVYGVNSRVSKILKEMAPHEANGGHVLLRGR